jgi:hypothetical protein
VCHTPCRTDSFGFQGESWLIVGDVDADVEWLFMAGGCQFVGRTAYTSLMTGRPGIR